MVWTDPGPTPRFGALARRLRNYARFSQGSLAQAAGLSPSTVRGWEAGRSEPSMPEFSRWIRALDIPDSFGGAVRATLYAPRAWADRPGVGLGPYIRERRLASGATLSRAAVELSLPLATLGHYESGRVEVPPAILSRIVDRFDLSAVEHAALCGGTGTFLEWCDSLVMDPETAQKSLDRAAFAASADELLDRGPAFIRLRTGLLRVRLRGDGWAKEELFATAHHALWLSVQERRTEAAAALAALPDENGPVAAIARRYLGRARAEELLALAAASADPAQAAWLKAEAALDLSERRRGPEARILIETARAEADGLSGWTESWMRRRDVARVALRLRDWTGVREQIDAMIALEPAEPAPWYAAQRRILESRLVAARPSVA